MRPHLPKHWTKRQCIKQARRDRAILSRLPEGWVHLTEFWPAPRWVIKAIDRQGDIELSIRRMNSDRRKRRRFNRPDDTEDIIAF